jgi:hypothetical protein
VMNSVGGIRTYTMDSDSRDWTDTRK